MLGRLIALVGALAAASPIHETFLEAKGPLGPIKGTMLSGDVKAGPVVLIVPGSGPTDRDGNSPMGVKAASYRLLAEQLGQRGITSVRIDKRGMFASAAAVVDPNAVTISEYASDVQAWVDAIKSSTKAPCVWVIGHSEGGLVALVAGRMPNDICGLVLVSAPGRPLADILKEQLHTNPANAPLAAQADKAIDALQAKERVDVSSFPPALAQLFRPAVQGFLIDEFAYDPVALLASFRKPVLILQGERDLQVSVTDARRLSESGRQAKLILLPNVNHVLKEVITDDRRANLATYADPSLPLAPGIADVVAKFVSGSGSAMSH